MLYAVVGSALITVAGLIYQSVATAIDKRRYPPPGKLVDIGGYRLYLNCYGNSPGGNPRIIMEAGAIGNSLTWGLIQPELARDAYVCVYDRAGLGWSDPGPGPRTGPQIASELHTLLSRAGVKGPFVLVGHSKGGLYARLYASQYPEEVAGMVLIDSVHEEQYGDGQTVRKTMMKTRLARIGSAVALIRLVGTLGLSTRLERFLNEAPADVRAINRAFYYRNQTWNTALSEAAALEDDARQLLTAEPLSDKPLAVITAGKGDDDDDEETRRLWLERQVKLVALSRQSTHVVAEQSGHFVQLDDTELVIRTIRHVVQTASRSYQSK